MSIKPKVGKCKSCSPDKGEQPLISGQCKDHYWKGRAVISKAKPKAKAKQAQKKVLGVFFASQILQIPARCEECESSLSQWKNSKIFARALVAHILPKREIGGFPSVATHPQNRMFFCPDCHTNFDNKGEDFGAALKCLPVMKERFNNFKSLLTEAEMQKIPKYLK